MPKIESAPNIKEDQSAVKTATPNLGSQKVSDPSFRQLATDYIKDGLSPIANGLSKPLDWGLTPTHRISHAITSTASNGIRNVGDDLGKNITEASSYLGKDGLIEKAGTLTGNIVKGGASFVAGTIETVHNAKVAIVELEMKAASKVIGIGGAPASAPSRLLSWAIHKAGDIQAAMGKMLCNSGAFVVEAPGRASGAVIVGMGKLLGGNGVIGQSMQEIGSGIGNFYKGGGDLFRSAGENYAKGVKTAYSVIAAPSDLVTATIDASVQTLQTPFTRTANTLDSLKIKSVSSQNPASITEQKSEPAQEQKNKAENSATPESKITSTIGQKIASNVIAFVERNKLDMSNPADREKIASARKIANTVVLGNEVAQALNEKDANKLTDVMNYVKKMDPNLRTDILNTVRSWKKDSQLNVSNSNSGAQAVQEVFESILANSSQNILASNKQISNPTTQTKTEPMISQEQVKTYKDSLADTIKKANTSYTEQYRLRTGLAYPPEEGIRNTTLRILSKELSNAVKESDSTRLEAIKEYVAILPQDKRNSWAQFVKTWETKGPQTNFRDSFASLLEKPQDFSMPDLSAYARQPRPVKPLNNLSPDEIVAKLKAARSSIQLETASPGAQKWWINFEKEHVERPEVPVQLAEELAKRNATADDLLKAIIYSGSETANGCLDYIDKMKNQTPPQAPKREPAPKLRQESKGTMLASL